MIYTASHTGKHHQVIEDAVLVGDVLVSSRNDILPIPKRGYVCVADGVGGNTGGAVASSFVLKELLKCNLPQDVIGLRQVLADINTRLVEEGLRNIDLSAMATTLTGVLLDAENIFLIHVGNSRCYVMQGNYLKQLTTDHTVYNWLKSSGREEEAESCNKNEITNCFGGGNPALLSKLLVSPMQEFGKMLLTSDGVHDYVDIDELEMILGESVSGDEKCNKIINAALDAGSEDDITVVFIDLAE